VAACSLAPLCQGSLTGSTTYATDGVDDGKRATTAAITTITETSTTKSVQRAREDNDTKRTTALPDVGGV